MKGSALLLSLGAAIGLILAAYGIARPARALPEGAVASVNGVPITRADYERALGESENREHVLERLIEEELLLQRGLELGIARSDARTRAALVSAMLSSIVLEGEQKEPADAELREHFAKNAEYFSGADALRVEQLFFAVTEAADDARVRARAKAARERLAHGASVDELRREADREPVPLPSVVSETKLVELLGPTAARAALSLAPGGVSEPARSGAGYHVLRLVERRRGERPRFEDVRDQVRADFLRRTGDQKLRKRLEELRREAVVVVAK